MKIFVSNALNEAEKEQLLAEGLDDVFFLHNEFDDNDEPHEEFLESNICFGNVPPSWLAVNPNLEWIQLISVGFGEYLNLNWEKLSLQIRMTNLAGFFAEPVAQSMLAGLLAIYRGIEQLTLLKESVKWVGDPIRENLKTLGNSKVLLFGYGSINQRFSKLIEPFGCQVNHLDDQSTLDELDQILPSADVVISTVPETSRTRGIFDKTRLKRFKQEAVFMNFGRGSVVDEYALIEILMQKRIRGAVIDVTMDEPLPENHGLWKCPNTIITQHSGGGTADEVPRKIEWFGDNLKRFRNGEALQGIVDFGRGY